MYSLRYVEFGRFRDAVLLLSRVLLVLLFMIFGLPKLTGFAATVSYMISLNVPFPLPAAVAAVFLEVVGALLIILGLYTRPVAVVLAFYTVATGVIGHAYWNMSVDAVLMKANMINFYKNISISCGFLLLAITGPGKWSLDRR